jgi:hypothetical protein
LARPIIRAGNAWFAATTGQLTSAQPRASMRSPDFQAAARANLID